MRSPLALLFLVAACELAPPTVSVDVDLAPGVPARADLARLELVVVRCEDRAEIGRVALEPGGGEAPRAELPVVPGEAFSVGLEGWIGCEEACVPPSTARAGDCVCGAAGPQRRVAEACSEWLVATGDLAVRVTLAPPSGFCPAPPPVAGCPAR